MTRLDVALAELADAIREEVRAELEQGSDAPSRLLSINEASDRLGVGRTTLYEEIAAGRIESVSLGRRRLIPERALTALINGPRTSLNSGAGSTPAAITRRPAESTRGHHRASCRSG